ncbi:hypothetical protein TNIN_377221 [Trichonephila inaurata madagascariensis]|nr:hypothetical protein TNIN_377221 [Trichonephila inaurata madagascariensis]
MRLEKSDEGMGLPKGTEKVRPLESERAYMLSMDPEAVAQPVTVEEDNCLPRDSSNENSEFLLMRCVKLKKHQNYLRENS